MSYFAPCFAFLALVFVGARCEVVYKWDKSTILPQMGLNNWRATSFALTKDKVFLTLVDVEKPNSGNGVVGAFNHSKSMSPDVSIFPFQNFYKINDPERGKITTPMSVRTDECERLWLLDSAVQNISGMQFKTNPGIYVFNTKNFQLIRSFNIPPNQWTSTSFFVNFVVGTENTDHDCEESFGYFADFNRFHLLTYDFLRNKSELKSHPFFSPDPLIHTPEEYIFNRGHQDLNGVYGLALAEYHSPEMMDMLYFHPLAGTHEFRITTQTLKTEGKVNYNDVEVWKDKGKDTESGISVFDSTTNTIFYAELNTKKIGAFKVKNSGDPDSTYYRYDFQLQSGRIVDLSPRESELWALIDGDSQIAIHKLPIADIIAEAHTAHKNHTTPPIQSSASQQIINLGLFYFIISFSIGIISVFSS